jgi:hypothetical protein
MGPTQSELPRPWREGLEQRLAGAPDAGGVVGVMNQAAFRTSPRLRQSVPALLLRLICLAVFLAAGAMLALASVLSPQLLPGAEDDAVLGWAAYGLGTHTQLQTLCGWRGAKPCRCWLRFGIPCPTCGMTTAVSLLVHGRPFRSLACQPFGCLLGIVSALSLPASVAGFVTGRCPRISVSDWFLERAIALTAVFFAASWLYKIIAMRLMLG